MFKLYSLLCLIDVKNGGTERIQMFWFQGLKHSFLKYYLLFFHSFLIHFCVSLLTFNNHQLCIRFMHKLWTRFQETFFDNSFNKKFVSKNDNFTSFLDGPTRPVSLLTLDYCQEVLHSHPGQLPSKKCLFSGYWKKPWTFLDVALLPVILSWSTKIHNPSRFLLNQVGLGFLHLKATFSDT